MATGRGVRGSLALVAVAWVVAVAGAGSLAVAALRTAGGSPDDTVITAQEAAQLASSAATAAPSPTASPPPPSPTVSPSATTAPTTPAPTPPTSEPPATDGVTRLPVGAGTLGVRCDGNRPLLEWSVPAAGWAVTEVREEDDELEVRLRAAQDELKVTVACAGGVPVVVEAE